MDSYGGGCSESEPVTEIPPEPVTEIAAGDVSSESVAFLIRAVNADFIAYLTEPAGKENTPTSEEIFASGSVEEAPSSFKKFTVSGLQPETDYAVYAAARCGNTYGRTVKLDITTSSVPPVTDPPSLLAFIEASKTGFTYRVQPAEESDAYFHAYLEKWAYDYLWESFDGSPDSPSDVGRFLTDILADYGMESSGTRNITWKAGDENPPREGFATIVGGKNYYAIASTFDPETLVWTGNPEATAFSTPPAGESSCCMDITIEDLTPERLTTCIKPGEGINFYFYHLFQSDVVRQYIAEHGEEAFRNHLYEYGYVARENYTDLWEVSPGTDYTIAVLGVDTEGDVMYTHKDFTAPLPKPAVEVSLQPYENELEGYYRWQSLEASVVLHNFGGTYAAEGMWALLPGETVDAALEMLGADATVEQCVLEGYLMLYPMDPECTALLSTQGNFAAFFNDLEEHTEYCFITMLPDPEGNPVVSHASASTASKPGTAEPEPEYLSYLGRWKVTGKSTEDWSSELSYDISIEQLTPNVSFLVKGWSASDIGDEKPFVMNYDPDTKRVYIRAPQSLGTRTDNGIEYNIVFSGYFVFGITDDLTPLSGTTYTAYTGYINDDYLTLLPEIFEWEGRTYSFKSIGYGGYADGAHHFLSGDEYNMIDFRIVRVSGSDFAGRPEKHVPTGPSFHTAPMKVTQTAADERRLKRPYRTGDRVNEIRTGRIR